MWDNALLHVFSCDLLLLFLYTISVEKTSFTGHSTCQVAGQHPSHNQSVWGVFPFKGEICQENTAISLLHRVLYFLSVNFYVVKIYGFSCPLFAQIDVYILSVCYLNTVLTLIPFTVVAPFLISVLLYFLMICISFLISHLLATQECS